MWRIINSELGRSGRERLDFTDVIRDRNSKPFPNKQDLVDDLNNEFVSAAVQCSAPPANSILSLAALLASIPPTDSSIRLSEFTPYEVELILRYRIAAKNSADIYDLSTNLLKFVASSICYSVAYLFNVCIRQGLFPCALKKVKISPLYKGKGQKSDVKSYRPISLVPGLSKIFEVGINARLLSFWTCRNTMSDRQYAYREGRSTTDLVREVVRGVLCAREASRQVAMICCDLSRAFDTADHTLVAEKLNHYGIRGPALSLLVSFMTERVQVVVGDRGKVRSVELT